MSLDFRDLQLLPPPECVPDGQWLAKIGQDKIMLVLHRCAEHATVNEHQVPQLVASACFDGELASDLVERRQQVINRLKAMASEVASWVEFAEHIRKAVHIDVCLDEIKMSG